MPARSRQSHEVSPNPHPALEARASGRELPTDGFVRLETVLNLIPVGRSTWWKGVREGRFPRPVKLGPRTTAWRVDDIRQLISSW
jgi:prophage regulatory protein